ncbi:MAG: redoxin family protein [Planctomycetaceae bacterium]|nr:redoxin family protein [Planctomycetaceae bacterium]
MSSPLYFEANAVRILALAIGMSVTVECLGQDSDTEAIGKDIPTATVVCSVVNDEGKPLPGVQVELLKWTGKFESFGAHAGTDVAGEAELTFAHSDDYFYMLFSADGYARSMLNFQIDAGETQHLSFQLSPAVRPWVEVKADGQPLAGVEVSRIDFVDRNGSKVYLLKDSAPALGFEFLQSDNTGRLTLPSLPANAKFDLWVVHPKWKTAKVEGLLATTEKVANIELESGVPVTLVVSTESEDVSVLEGQEVSVLMMPTSGGSSAPQTVRHVFPIRDGELRFTANPVEYSTLRTEFDDYFPTPYLMNYPQFPMPELDLSDNEPAELKIHLRKKVKARGRVIGPQGEGVSGALVTSSIANDHSSTTQTTTKASDQEETATPPTDPLWVSLRNWTSGGSGQSDAEGRYEIDVALGPVKLEVIREGYFSSPVQTEAVVTDPEHETLPDLKVLPVPELQGVVQDEDGRPVIGAIVRMRHRGRGDADPVGETSADGSFQLSMSRIPYASDGSGLQTDVSVVAIDPRSNRGGIADVDLTDMSSSSEIRITVSERSPDWALTVVQPEASLTDEQRRALMKERAEQFPEGITGKVSPDLSQGTWLNTEARSLQDFRGKFVLLDFWFIGCGPCHRDMPTVKLLHKKFLDQGFSVISVHTDGQTPEAVQKFAADNGMDYPIVVDTPDGAITSEYASLGVSSYPMYILLGPDGRIIHNDATATDAFSLRMYKIEMIYRELREQSH